MSLLQSIIAASKYLYQLAKQAYGAGASLRLNEVVAARWSSACEKMMATDAKLGDDLGLPRHKLARYAAINQANMFTCIRFVNGLVVATSFWNLL